MRRLVLLSALWGGAVLLAIPVPVGADEIVPGHPRVSEIDKRLERQQNRTEAGVKDGQINANQEARDSNADARVASQLSKDQAADGGHITKRQQRKLNNELNQNSGRIHRQRQGEIVPGHPRISEIDGRLDKQQDRTDAGVKDGQINAKQEARDSKADARVAGQMSKDEAADGGHITKGEQAHLNKELNRNSERIHRQRHGKKGGEKGEKGGK
jgi:hypothetical protein